MVAKKKILDKKFVPTIAAITVLIALGAVTIPVYQNRAALQQEATQQQKHFLTFNQEEIGSIKIESPISPSLNMLIERQKDNSWTVNGVEAYTPDIQKIMLALQQVNIYDKIDEYASLEDFGLFPPQKILTLTYKDPTQKPIIIKVGTYTPASKQVYAKYSDAEPIYILGKTLYNATLVTANGLFNKDVFKLDSEALTHFTVKRNGETYNMVKEGEDWHVVVKDGAKVLGDDQAIQSIISFIFGNSGESLVRKNADDLSRFKLDKPAIEIFAETKEGKKAHVIVSPPVDGTQASYVANLETNNVYIWYKPKIDRVTFSELDIRNKEIITPKFSDIRSIEIIRDGKPYKFFINKNRLWDSKDIKNEPVNINQYVEDLSTLFFNVSTSLRENEFKEDLGFSNPRVKIALTLDKKEKESPYTVLIGNKSKEYDGYYVKISGDPFIYMINQETFEFIYNFGLKKQ